MRQEHEPRSRVVHLFDRGGTTRELEAFVSAERIPRQLNRVMIVSSDDDLPLLLQFLLETDGFQVSVCRTADIAMRTLLQYPPKAMFFALSLQEGNSMSFLEFVQESCPDISIFTVVRPECRTLEEKSLQAVAQGCLLTPVDYRGVKTLLAGSSMGSKQRSLRHKDDPATIAAN